LNGSRRRVHFVGVGGIGMSGLAEILLNLGYEVSGSDIQSSGITERLERSGLRFSEGHAADHISDAGIVVVSAAVAEDNVEILAARERNVPVLHRGDMLADLMRLKPNAVVVGGSHGKTTTTSMVTAILDHADIGATSIVGGILHRSGTNARWGTGDYMVAEADEHDGSFLRLHPTIAVVTNIDAEHLEYYGTLDNIKRAFTDFCNGVPFYGYSILCWDDANTRSVLEHIESICITYGLDADASLSGASVSVSSDTEDASLSTRLSGLRTRFEVTCQDELLGAVGKLGSLEIRAIGLDNVRNALAACAVGLCLGMPFELIAEGLREYEGVERRLQVHGEVRGVAVVEDYAHHPTEIASTLEAVRWAEPKRIICVLQPHLYSRTKFFSEDFARVLGTADRAIVTEIYGSREEPLPGVDAGLIVDAAHRQGASHVELVNDMHEVAARLAPELTEGDVVLVLGAGHIGRIVPGLLEELAAT